MDKGLLFQFMRVKFREAGFPQAEVDLHMQSFAERYQNQTDEEMEADIRRRGGPTRIAAATIERRNTVLMADADYHAFVETAMAAEANGKSDVPETAETADTETAVDTDTVADTAAADEKKADTANDDDPLAAWFSMTESKAAADSKEDDAVPPLFSEPAQTAPSEDTDGSIAATAEIPAVRTVHTAAPIGGSEETRAPSPAQTQPDRAASQPQAPEVTSHAEVTPQPKPQMPPRPAVDADMGRTKVMQVPTASSNPAPQPRPTADGSYQKEQAAIWGASTGVRDGKGTAAPRRAAAQTAEPAQKKPVQTPPQPRQKKAAQEKTEYADRGTVTRLQEKTYWGEGSADGVKRFRIIMAVSIPFAFVLLLAYAVLALGLIAAMAALIAAFIVGLVAEVAVGSLIALVAVIYGISQLFLVLPVGMFELGLGIAAIGVTMFVGILMYNVAVRLLPFLLKQFIAFQSVFKGFVQDLYYYVKGECYRR